MRVLLATYALCAFGAPALAQEPNSHPAPGALTPAHAQAWISWQNLAKHAEARSQSPAGLALQKWQEQGGSLAREWSSLAAALEQYATSRGMAPALVRECLSTQGTFAWLGGESGSAFCGHVSLQGHGDAIEIALKPHEKRDAESAVTSYELPMPLGYPGSFWLRRDGDRLLLADSSKTLDLLSELRKGEGAALSADPDFERAMNSDRTKEDLENTWLRCFVRPAALRNPNSPFAGLGQSGIWKQGLGDCAGLFWSSQWQDGSYRDLVTIALRGEDRAPLDQLGSEAVAPELAHLIPRLAERCLLATIDPAKLLVRLDESGARLPGGFNLQELELQLLAKQQIENREALTSLLGDNLIWIGDPKCAGASMISIALADSFRTESVLQTLGKLRNENEDEATGPKFFELPGKGQSYFGTVFQDRLYLSEHEKPLRAWLADIEQGQVLGAEFAERLKSANAPLVGTESPRCLLVATDANNDHGLRELADDADHWSYTGRFLGDCLTIGTRSATGPLPAFGLGLAEYLPGLLQHRAAHNESLVRGFAESVAEAQLAWLALEKKRGNPQPRPTSLPELAKAELLRVNRNELIENDTFQRSGYRHRILLDDANPNSWLLLSWPRDPGITGRACFARGATDELFRNPWIDKLDLELGPMPHQIFAGDPFTSRMASTWDSGKTPVPVAEAQPEATPEAATPAAANLPLEKSLELVDAFAEQKDLEQLRPLLDHVEPAVQARAAHRLGELEDRESVPTLARLACDSADAEVRRRATWSLSRMRDPRTDATLLSLTSDPDAKVRVFAVQGLSRGQSPGIDEALFELIQAFPRDEAGERSLAVLVLADRKALALLPKLAAVPASTPRFAAALTSCFSALSPTLAPEKEGKLLIGALDSPVERLRLYAVERLAAEGHTEAVPALVAQLENEQGSLAVRIQEALAVLEPKPAIDVDAVLAKMKEHANTAWTSFRGLSKPIQLAVALTPFGLLMFWTVLRLRRRSRRRRQSSQDLLDLVQPSEDFESQSYEDPEYEDYDDSLLDEAPELHGAGFGDEEEAPIGGPEDEERPY